jgi:hypothetical protein
MNELVTAIIDQMEQIHEGNGWIGVNFKKKVCGLSETEFFHRLNGMHSIAEIVAHLSTWRLESILKIKTGKGSITDDDPSNWKSNRILKQIGKEEILLKHHESLLKLLNLLRQKNDDFLSEMYYDTDFKSNYPYSFLVQGMLHHDIYHLGQIGLLIKCQESNSGK